MMKKQEWQKFIDTWPEEYKKSFLKTVLRLRRKVVSISCNGTFWFVKRSLMRDYLKEII